MTPDAIAGLWAVLVIILAWIVLGPIVCWVLPDRSHSSPDQTTRA
jgi:hypothetical protein